jgi:hypothetical protein
MVVSAGLRFLYSFLYREYITHIQVLSFLLLPYPPVHDLPLVCPVFHIISVFVLGLYSTWERTGSFWPSESNLRCCSPVPTVYLQMTTLHSSL